VVLWRAFSQTESIVRRWEIVVALVKRVVANNRKFVSWSLKLHGKMMESRGPCCAAIISLLAPRLNNDSLHITKTTYLTHPSLRTCLRKMVEAPVRGLTLNSQLPCQPLKCALFPKV
jgi:hypothetical protein